MEQTIAKELFNMEEKTAQNQSVCISCRSKVYKRKISEMQRLEYAYCTLCPECIDEIGEEHVN